MTIEEIAKCFSKNYGDLYNGKYPYAVERGLCDLGEYILHKRDDVLNALVSYREDYLTSDRELAAYALTLYELCLV